MKAQVYYDNDTRVATSGREIHYHRINVHADEDVKEILRMLKKDKGNWGDALGMLIEVGAKAYDRIGGFSIEENNEKRRNRETCLSCSESYSDDDENGNMILRCAMRDYRIVKDDDHCKDWN